MQIDIHSHILPGVDDGSKDLETSLALLKIAVAGGTTDIIATPHVLDANSALTWDAIQYRVETLQKEANQHHIPIRIYPGAETELNWDLLELIRENRSSFCLAGSRYLLMEMPSLALPPHLDELIYELQLMEIVPVLAHPERQMQLMEQPQKLLELLKKGCLTQCNGGSLTGVFGLKVHDNVHMLLNQAMICFMGSDAHNLRHRNSDLQGAREKLTAYWGEGTAQEILTVRPNYILENKMLPQELFAERLPALVVCPKNEKPAKKGFCPNFWLNENQSI